MTKKETTTPVVKEEKAKAKRGRKPKATEKPVVVETPLQPDVVEEKPLVSVQEEIEHAVSEAKAKAKEETDADTMGQLQSTRNALDESKALYAVSEAKAKAKEETDAVINEYKSKASAAQVELSSLKKTFNQLKDDYKVIKNKYNQASADAAEKKTELHNLKNQWKTTKKAYDDTMGQLQSTRNSLEDAKALCNELEIEYRRVRMLGIIYACIGGAALIALAIVSILYC